MITQQYQSNQKHRKFEKLPARTEKGCQINTEKI